MLVFAVDPGPLKSAWVLYDHANRRILEHGIDYNELLRYEIKRSFKQYQLTNIVCEMVACYGQPVGAEVFATCVEIGRFVEVACGFVRLITRAEVKKHLCHKVVGINDAVIRQRLIDLFGGKESAIGRKKSPGPLYGIHADEWAALAVAVVAAEAEGE